MISPIAKMIVALISTVTGFAGEIITYGLVAGTARVWLMLGIGLLTAVGNVLGVYLVPNVPATKVVAASTLAAHTLDPTFLPPTEQAKARGEMNPPPTP